MKKKTAAQLEREIAAALTRPTNHHATMSGGVRFDELIREDDPGAMQVAEDLLLSQGRKMREATGGMRARNFTIELRPMWGPKEEWKMVQTNVDPGLAWKGKGLPGKANWIKLTAANGPGRVTREWKMVGSADEARKLAVATAWAVAKAIKTLPLDTPEKALEKIVARIVAKKSKNMIPEELF